MNALSRAARACASRAWATRTASRAMAMKCPHDPSKPFHKSPLPLDHAGGLLEYSVVYTDRAMNHMSAPFCKVRGPSSIGPLPSRRARRVAGGRVPGRAAKGRVVDKTRARSFQILHLWFPL